MTPKSDSIRASGRSVQVTSLDREYWPEDGISKGDVLTWYRDIAPILLPYLKDRPVTLRVFPRGIAGPGHYRRDRPDSAPDWIRHVEYQTATDGHTLEALVIDDAASLIWAANTGAIEFHLWCAHLPDLDEPDVIVLDLDPGDSAPFTDVLKAAGVVRDELERQQVRGYAKTSGGRGLHVFLPLKPGRTFDEVRDWVSALAERLENAHPKLIAAAHGGTHKGRLITIDHAQNSIGRNTAAPYTLRARPGAPVSTPVTWDEVDDGEFTPDDFTLRNIRARVKKIGDVFKPVLAANQELPSPD